MIAILMLLSHGGAATIVRWSIGAGQERMDWVEVHLPAPSYRVDRYLKVTEGDGTWSRF